MKDEYKIVDESELPQLKKSSRRRWRDLAALLETLPSGKWIEVPVEEGKLPKQVGLSIFRSMRVGRKPIGVSYRTDCTSHRLFVTRKSLNGDAK